MNSPQVINRFTKELFELIYQVNGISVNVHKSKEISRNYLIEVMEVAASNPSRMAYDLPLHCKNLAYVSNSTLSIKDCRAVIKGLIGYKKENDPAQIGYDVKDIPLVRNVAIRNSQKYLMIIDALKKWK